MTTKTMKNQSENKKKRVFISTTKTYLLMLN